MATTIYEDKGDAAAGSEASYSMSVSDISSAFEYPFTGVYVGAHSTPTFVDLDSDSDLDLIIGAGNGNLYYYENTGTRSQPNFTAPAVSANPLGGVNVDSDSAPTFADLDDDGDLDLIVGAGNGNLYYYENTGTRSQPNFTALAGTANPLSDVSVGYEDIVPTFADLDDDGDLDLVMGEYYGGLYYYENIGTRSQPDFTRTDVINPLYSIYVAGTHHVPVFVDLDDDGDLDLVVGKHDGDLLYYENMGTSSQPDFTERTGDANPMNGIDKGDHSTPAFADLDDDGDLDLVMGEGEFPDELPDPMDDRLLYYENTGTRTKASFTFIPANTSRIDGTDADDHLIGDDMDNEIYGKGGNDILQGKGGNDKLNGEAGNDTASYIDSNAGVQVNLDAGDAAGGSAAGDTLISVENLTGSKHADTLTGDNNNNTLKGLEGDDTLDGGAGDDTLAGGADADTLAGDDGNDTLDGGAGDDTLIGGAGSDTLIGGGGSDTVSYAGSDKPVAVLLSYGHLVQQGHAQGDTLSGIENLMGSEHNDLLLGDGNANRLTGGDGDDALNGYGGDDELEGGGGADDMEGGSGGSDTVSYAASDAGVTVDLQTQSASGGHAQGDRISGFENVTGSDHADTLIGSDGANRLKSGYGDDTLTGGAGEDVFIFAYNIVLVLGPAGYYDDLIVANGKDTITDFADGEDRIEIELGVFGIEDFDDLQEKITQDGNNTLITFDADNGITLENVDMAIIGADDFIFVA